MSTVLGAQGPISAAFRQFAAAQCCFTRLSVMGADLRRRFGVATSSRFTKEQQAMPTSAASIPEAAQPGSRLRDQYRLAELRFAGQATGLPATSIDSATNMLRWRPGCQPSALILLDSSIWCNGVTRNQNEREHHRRGGLLNRICSLRRRLQRTDTLELLPALPVKPCRTGGKPAPA